MAVIGQLAVNIVAKTDAFTKGISAVQKKLQQFTRVSDWMRTVGVGIVGQQIMAAADSASELVDLSAATGIAIEQLDFLRYAAKQTGADMNNVTMAIRELVKKGIDPNRLEEIANRLNGISDPTQRARKALDILGKRGGLALLPMLRDLPALKKRFAELGGSVSTALANRMDMIGDSLEDVRLAMRNMWLQVADALLPAIRRFTNFVITAARAVSSLAKQHPTLVDWMTKAVVVFGVLTPACWGLNQALMAIKGTLYAINLIAKAGIIQKLIGLLIAYPAIGVALAAAAGGGAAYQYYRGSESYSGSRGASRGWDVDNTARQETQIKEQRRTNDILSQMIRGGGNSAQPVLVAGGRG